MTALLVSVRNAAEAEEAIAGGAAIIDVKEPSRGPLGRADLATMNRVVAAVAGRRPVSAAGGELHEAFGRGIAAGISWVKVGLADAASLRDWRRNLREMRARTERRPGARFVA